MAIGEKRLKAVDYSYKKVPSFVDGRIAAVAWVNDMILVTRDAGEFKSFQDLRILNWHKDG